MQEFNLKKDDDSIIYGVIYNYDSNVEDDLVEKVMIACHGFGSNKKGETIRTLAEGLPNVVIVSCDWPAHGESKEKLLLSNCLRNYEEVYKFVREKFSNATIYLFGSSFGAYMTLQLLRKHPEYEVKKAFFKSPAIKMEECVKRVIPDDIENYKGKSYVTEDGMEVPYKFYEELNENKLTIDNINKNVPIYIYHGSKDSISLVSDIKQYNLANIKLTVLEDAEHSYRGPYMDRVIGFIKDEI